MQPAPGASAAVDDTTSSTPRTMCTIAIRLRVARTRPRPKRRASAAPCAGRPAQRGKSKPTAPNTTPTSAAGARAGTGKAVADVVPTRKSAHIINEKKARKAKAAMRFEALVCCSLYCLGVCFGDGGKNAAKSVPCKTQERAGYHMF